jgi:hypothetical protein
VAVVREPAGQLGLRDDRLLRRRDVDTNAWAGTLENPSRCIVRRRLFRPVRTLRGRPVGRAGPGRRRDGRSGRNLRRVAALRNAQLPTLEPLSDAELEKLLCTPASDMIRGFP